MKIRKKLCTITLMILPFVLTGCNIEDYTFDSNQAEKEQIVSLKPNLSDISNTTTYQSYKQEDKYITSTTVSTTIEDKISIMDRYKLPNLDRINDDEKAIYTNALKVIKRVDILGIDVNQLYIPKYNWKQLYNNSINKVKEFLEIDSEVEFVGSSTSELNKYLNENSGKKINIVSSELKVDEVLNIPSNTYIKGNKTKLLMQEKREEVIKIEDKSNICIEGFVLEQNFVQGIDVNSSKQVILINNAITNGSGTGISIQGSSEDIQIINNYISGNKGGIILNGEISNSIIENNTITNCKGSDRTDSGIVMIGLQDDSIENITSSPYNNIIRNNNILGNTMMGILSDSGYNNYIIQNTIQDNYQEGIGLYRGTIGTYIESNILENNGNGQAQLNQITNKDEELKRAAITMNNSAYNMIFNNNISNNYGSGISLMSSSARNIITDNTIQNNNRAHSEKTYYYGIEIGEGFEGEDNTKQDSTPCYENIINRNNISIGHYSGIFISEGSYMNDIFDNIIMDAEQFSIEVRGNKHNNQVNNIMNKPVSNE